MEAFERERGSGALVWSSDLYHPIVSTSLLMSGGGTGARGRNERLFARDVREKERKKKKKKEKTWRGQEEQSASCSLAC